MDDETGNDVSLANWNQGLKKVCEDSIFQKAISSMEGWFIKRCPLR